MQIGRVINECHQQAREVVERLWTRLAYAIGQQKNRIIDRTQV